MAVLKVPAQVAAAAAAAAAAGCRGATAGAPFSPPARGLKEGISTEADKAAPKAAPNGGGGGGGTGAGDEPAALGARLAAFAVGCLGAPSAAKAGTRLGLMGSANEEEFRHVLWHLETLSRQRAAKLAGVDFRCVSEGEAAEGVPDAPKMSSCSEAFALALREACGIGLADLFAKLPGDGQGRADLLRVFEMAEKRGPQPGAKPPAGGAVAGDAVADMRALCPDMPGDYVENAGDLPHVTSAALAAAEAQLNSEVLEASWTTDMIAVNIVRSAFAHVVEPGAQRPQTTSALLSCISGRCGSKRPALGKSALRALTELAERRLGPSEEGCADTAWTDAAQPAFGACLNAARGTKLVARLAEDTLLTVAQRVSQEADSSVAVRELAACIAAEASGRMPQAAVVGSGLKILALLTPGLAAVEAGSAAAGDAKAAIAAAAAVCSDVLDNRKLAPAFSQARATRAALPAAEEAAAEAAVAADEAPAAEVPAADAPAGAAAAPTGS
mmetsp:Transcript_174551/g.559609  ORF Transcript_174551/g.559609 Transcript_174551/m.559609 type:complete len:500 (+) Transcript_174551:111-1610(+)